MSFLKTIDTHPSFTPHESGPLPERLISGDPMFRTWAQDVARGESIHTGVWEATPGETRSTKGDTFEFCHTSPHLGGSSATARSAPWRRAALSLR